MHDCSLAMCLLDPRWGRLAHFGAAGKGAVQARPQGNRFSEPVAHPRVFLWVETNPPHNSMCKRLLRRSELAQKNSLFGRSKGGAHLTTGLFRVVLRWDLAGSTRWRARRMCFGPLRRNHQT